MVLVGDGGSSPLASSSEILSFLPKKASTSSVDKEAHNYKK